MNPFLDKLFHTVKSTMSLARKVEREQAKDFGIQTKNVPPAVWTKQLATAKAMQAEKDKVQGLMDQKINEAVQKALENKQISQAPQREMEKPVIEKDGPKIETRPREGDDPETGVVIVSPGSNTLLSGCELPCPPGSGEYVLTSTDGVIKWTVVTAC